MGLLGSLAHLVEAPFKGAAHLVEDPSGWASNVAHQATDPKTLLGLAGALAIPGVGGLVSSIPGVGGALASGAGALGIGGGATGGTASAIPDAAMGIGGAATGADAAAGSSGVLGSLEGLAGKAGSFLTGNGGKNALATASALSSYLNQQKANDYAKNALGSIEDSYTQRAPLRTQGLATLAGSQAGNPYATGQPNALPLRGG